MDETGALANDLGQLCGLRLPEKGSLRYPSAILVNIN
jgi:hypothetical protein